MPGGAGRDRKELPPSSPSPARPLGTARPEERVPKGDLFWEPWRKVSDWSQGCRGGSALLVAGRSWADQILVDSILGPQVVVICLWEASPG